MSHDAIAELLHTVSNLLAVIHSQVAAARAAGSPTAQARALELIEEAALRTGEAVRSFRAGEEGQRGSD